MCTYVYVCELVLGYFLKTYFLPQSNNSSLTFLFPSQSSLSLLSLHTAGNRNDYTRDNPLGSKRASEIFLSSRKLESSSTFFKFTFEKDGRKQEEEKVFVKSNSVPSASIFP